MRYAVVLLLAPAVSLAQENEGEKLFRQMEEKLMKAQTIQLASEVSFKGMGKDGTMKSRVRIAEGNKSHVSLDLLTQGMPIQVDAVSDGATLQTTVAGQPPQSSPVKAGMDKLLRASIARIGPFGIAMMVFRSSPQDADKDLDPNKLLRMSDFKAEPGEKILGRDTRVLSYKLEVAQEKNAGRVKLWLDAKTLLPVKRVIEIENESVITETYTDATLDGKIDPKTFELTK